MLQDATCPWEGTCWKMLRALLLWVAAWASLQERQLTVTALCVHDSGNQKGAVILNPAHSKGNCRNLFSVWDLYEFAGSKMTPWPQEMSLCPATCRVRVQPPSSWCCSLGEMLWIEFWISSSLTQLTHFSRPHLKQGLNWPPQYKGPLDSVKKFLRSFAKQPQSLWSSICLSSSARAAWEIYISQEMHLQSLFQLFFLKKSFFFSQSH